MTHKFFSLVALAIALCAAPIEALAVTGSSYPSLVLKNQFGETYINSVLNGSSDQLDCNFVVDATNGNGLGIRSLKGAPCAAVYMHTSATPATGNPNPPSGYIYVQLAANYFGYVGGYSGFVSPLSGSNVSISSGLSANSVYVITSVGTSTAANWQAIGLPLGLTPTVGQAFVASTSSAGTGTGTVQLAAASGSGISAIDVIGDANQTVGATGGAYLILRALGATNSSTTTLQATAPAAGTVIGLRFVMLPLSSQLK